MASTHTHIQIVSAGEKTKHTHTKKLLGNSNSYWSQPRTMFIFHHKDTKRGKLKKQNTLI